MSLSRPSSEEMVAVPAALVADVRAALDLCGHSPEIHRAVKALEDAVAPPHAVLHPEGWEEADSPYAILENEGALLVLPSGESTSVSLQPSVKGENLSYIEGARWAGAKLYRRAPLPQEKPQPLDDLEAIYRALSEKGPPEPCAAEAFERIEALVKGGGASSPDAEGPTHG